MQLGQIKPIDELISDSGNSQSILTSSEITSEDLSENETTSSPESEFTESLPQHLRAS